MDNGNVPQVNIVDIKMPFWSLVFFMVKAAIASIPAFIILSIIGMVVFSIFGAIVGGVAHP